MRTITIVTSTAGGIRDDLRRFVGLDRARRQERFVPPPSQGPAQAVRPGQAKVCHVGLRARRNHHLLVRCPRGGLGPGFYRHVVGRYRFGCLSVGACIAPAISRCLATAAEVSGQTGYFLCRFHQYGGHAGSGDRGCFHGRRAFSAGQPGFLPAPVSGHAAVDRVPTPFPFPDPFSFSSFPFPSFSPFLFPFFFLFFSDPHFLFNAYQEEDQEPNIHEHAHLWNDNALIQMNPSIRLPPGYLPEQEDLRTNNVGIWLKLYL